MSTTRRSPLLSVWLLLGYTFLYAPIVILIIFSFNESKLVTVWAGFSTKWYGELLQDRQMLSAAWLSLRLALMKEWIKPVQQTFLRQQSQPNQVWDLGHTRYWWRLNHQ